MIITKADGSKEPFDPKKLQKSLRRAGASQKEIDRIVSHIESELHGGDHTQRIYRHAFEMLQKDVAPSTSIAAKYSLRRALFGLGPTGFPFEEFLARMFQNDGYTTQTGTLVEGKCATHEIDVIGFREDDSFAAEAKFHARQGIRSDLQVAMYSYARFLDIKDQKSCTDDVCGIKRFSLITNTKFTSMAIKYAECNGGIDLISWGYPEETCLQKRIEDARIYPITALSTLKKAHKKILLDSGVILCDDILKNPNLLSPLSMSSKKAEATLAEARALCVDAPTKS